MDVAVRRITDADGPLLKDTRLSALRDAPGDHSGTLAGAEELTDDRWQEIAAGNASGSSQAIWFAEVDGATAGMLAAFRTFDDVVTLTSLWARPGFRQVGVADALVEVATSWALAGNGRWLRLWLRERNEAVRAFWTDLGFEATGAWMAYEPDPTQRDVELRKPLAAS
jgi:GNAT superfamily N-acetyltransferase